MILKGSIQNKKELIQMFREMKQKQNPDHPPPKPSFSLKDISSLLCHRFLTIPIKHDACNTTFCRDCIFKWTSIFHFCPKCKADLTPESVQTWEIDEDIFEIIRSTKVECSLGKCGKTVDEVKHEVNSQNMPVIIEREVAEETSEQEEEDKPFFWNWFSKKKRRSSFQSSDVFSLENSNLQNSDLMNMFGTSSSINISVDNSGIMNSETRQKRYFSVNDYVLHLVRKHSWPSMEITVDSKNQKISFAGYKKEKHVKQGSKFKMGPGVVHSIEKDRRVRSLVGIYVNDELKKNVKIFQDFQLIFEGKLMNGFFEHFGRMRWKAPMDASVELSQPLDLRLEYVGGFQRGKPHGKGKLQLVGDQEAASEYFEEKNRAVLESQINVQVFYSNEPPSSLDSFFIKFGKYKFANSSCLSTQCNASCSITPRLPIRRVHAQSGQTKEAKYSVTNRNFAK